MLIKRVRNSKKRSFGTERYEGTLITCARALLSMTQKELADATGWSGASISSWEMGRTVPSPGLVDSVIKFLKSQGIDLMEDGIRYIRPHETRTRLPDLLTVLQRTYVIYHPVMEVEDRLALRACLLDFGIEPDAQIEQIEVDPPRPPAAPDAESAAPTESTESADPPTETTKSLEGFTPQPPETPDAG